MYLTLKTTFKLSKEEAMTLDEMTHQAKILWNDCNYERRNDPGYQEFKYKNYDYQVKKHMNDSSYMLLPPRTSVEVCANVHRSWKSHFALLDLEDYKDIAKPPKYKQHDIPVTFKTRGFYFNRHNSSVKVYLPIRLQDKMKKIYHINIESLNLTNTKLADLDNIILITLFPPNKKNVARALIVYGKTVSPYDLKPKNNQYLSIDIGARNLCTCYDSKNGNCFIVGRGYMSQIRKYDKKLASMQRQWSLCQAAKGIEYPHLSNHYFKVLKRRRNVIDSYLHRVTRYIINYALENNLNTIVIGDLEGLVKSKVSNKVTNKKIHNLRYDIMYSLFRYKCELAGLRFVLQDESYTSTCPPSSQEVSSTFAKKGNRIARGLYNDGGKLYNADCVGAYNILRKYLKANKIPLTLSLEHSNLQSPTLVNITATNKVEAEAPKQDRKD